MKKLILAALCIVMVAGVAQATNYTWISTATGPGNAYWNQPANWSPASVPGSSNMDNVLAPLTGNAELNFWPGTQNYTIGQFVATLGGTSILEFWTTSGSLTVSSAGVNGVGKLSGDFNVSGNNWGGYGSNPTFSVDGNFIVTAPGPGITYISALNLYGMDNGTAVTRNFTSTDGSGYRIPIVNLYGRYTDCSTTAQGAHIGVMTVKNSGATGHNGYLANSNQARNGNGDGWMVRNLYIEDRTKPWIAPGTNVSFTINTGADNINVARTLYPAWVPGGVTFPNDVSLGSQYAGEVGGVTITWKIDNRNNATGNNDFTARNFYIGLSTNTAGGTYVFNPVDNGPTPTQRNMIVNNFFQVAPDGYQYAIHGLFQGGSGNHRVGGNIRVGYNNGTHTSVNYDYGSGALQLGSSTLRVGGDWDISREPSTTSGRTGQVRGSEFIDSNWDPGTSTVIFDGNGTVRHISAQNFYGNGMPLYNMIVNNVGGTFTIGNEQYNNQYLHTPVILHNLEIDNGTFTGQHVPIIFRNDAAKDMHMLTRLTAGGFADNLVLEPGVVVRLGSNVTVSAGDNAVLGSGALIFLNGFTLTADGHTYNGATDLRDGVTPGPTWANDAGLVIASSGVPEPATLLLLGTGLMGAIARLRRRRVS